MTAPICPTCARESRLTTGQEIYPHRRDLYSKSFYKCDACGGYVGCHRGTTRSLGTPANDELRKARSLLHDRMIDPLWKTADRCGIYSPDDIYISPSQIRRWARTRVYAYLSYHLGIPADQTHTGMFDLETCLRAWSALQGKNYGDILDWVHEQKNHEGEAP